MHEKLSVLGSEATSTKEQLKVSESEVISMNKVIDDLRSRLDQRPTRSPGHATFSPSPSNSASYNIRAKRTSTCAFAPEKDLISNKVYRGNSETLRGPIDVVGPSGNAKGTGFPLSTVVSVNVPSRSNQTEDTSPTNSVPYPEDIASVSCLRIDVDKVTEKRWEDSVSDDLRELVRDHLKWSATRSKNFAVPKQDSSDVSVIQCHWNTIARSKIDRVCAWHDAQGVPTSPALFPVLPPPPLQRARNHGLPL